MILNEVLPDTTSIVNNELIKAMYILHPHFKEGQAGYKRFIKTLPLIFDTYKGYLFTVNGFCTYKGIHILNNIVKHIKKLEQVERVNLTLLQQHSMYTLIIKVKD